MIDDGVLCVCCSDGVSRTGAFCALYSVLERVKTEQIVDVFQAVKTLRIQRAGLLGTIVSLSHERGLSIYMTCLQWCFHMRLFDRRSTSLCIVL